MKTFSRMMMVGIAVAASLSGMGLMAQPGLAQSAPTASSGENPAGLPDQAPGRRFTIKADDLPAPGSKPIGSSQSVTIRYTGQQLRVPDGFTATPFATGLAHPRRLLVLPNGDVLVAEQRVGIVTLLRDENGDGKADQTARFVDGLRGPYGLAWRDGEVLIADQDGIWKVPYQPGAGGDDARSTTPIANGKTMITKRGVFGVVEGHNNRPIAIDPKSGALFVGVGSENNIALEPEVKATIQRFDADGSHQTTYSSGMRNPTSLAFQPGTGDLYAVVQERDGLGDNLVPDYLARVQQGAFYGWPYSYIGHYPQPGFAQLKPGKVQAAVAPDLLFQAHSSAMDILFYTGSQFPAEYNGDAFVALKGSWNRSEPSGYKIVRVPFKDGKPQGFYQNFATGFWSGGIHRAEVWGRPAALAIAKDGALLVADDTGGTVWRIAYTGGKSAGAGSAPSGASGH